MAKKPEATSPQPSPPEAERENVTPPAVQLQEPVEAPIPEAKVEWVRFEVFKVEEDEKSGIVRAWETGGGRLIECEKQYARALKPVKGAPYQCVEFQRRKFQILA